MMAVTIDDCLALIERERGVSVRIRCRLSASEFSDYALIWIRGFKLEVVSRLQGLFPGANHYRIR